MAERFALSVTVFFQGLIIGFNSSFTFHYPRFVKPFADLINTWINTILNEVLDYFDYCRLDFQFQLFFLFSSILRILAFDFLTMLWEFLAKKAGITINF